MEKDKKSVVREGVEAATIAGLAKAAGSMVTSDPTGAFVASTVVGTVLKTASSAWQWWSARRIETLFEAMRDDDTRTTEGAADWVQERLNDPRTVDAVLRSIRASLDAPDEASIFPLARLAKEYGGSGRPVDRYFRSVVQMLLHTTASDLEAMRYVLDFAAIQSGPDRSLVTFGLNIDKSARGFMRKGRDSQAHERVPLDRVDIDVSHIIRLLERNDLANDSPVHGGVGVELDRDVVERLSRLLAPVAPPSSLP